MQSKIAFFDEALQRSRESQLDGPELALRVGAESAQNLVPGLRLWPDFLSEEEGDGTLELGDSKSIGPVRRKTTGGIFGPEWAILEERAVRCAHALPCHMARAESWFWNRILFGTCSHNLPSPPAVT